MPKKVEKYLATVKVLGKLYKAEGKDVEDSITNLKPGIAKGMSILTVEYKGKKVDRVLPNIATARLFSSSPTVRNIHIKQVSRRFAL